MRPGPAPPGATRNAEASAREHGAGPLSQDCDRTGCWSPAARACVISGYDVGGAHAYHEASEGRRLGHAGGTADAARRLERRARARVDIGIDEGRLIVAPRMRPSQTLAELVAHGDETDPTDHEDRA